MPPSPRKQLLVLLAFIGLLFASCNEKSTKLRLVYSADEPIVQIANAIKNLADDSDKLAIELIIGEGSIANMDSIRANDADLTIVENHTPNKPGIASVAPIYPQIFHILYLSETEITDFNTLVEGRKVFMGLPGSGSYRFMEDLFQFFEVDRSKVTITDNPFDMEVYASFGDIIKDENLFGLEAFKLYSFDAVDKYGKGSVAEAICLKYPQMKPFVIPENTYRSLTPKPILTISVNAILITSKRVPTDVIYDLSEMLFTNQQEISSISPLIYAHLTEKFDPSKLNFPLHSGARQYLEKDKPSFFERYAEVIGIIFTIIVTLISGLASLARWRGQAKKDRIDVFYEKIIAIKKEIPQLKSFQEVKTKIVELQKEQDLAFEMLIDEKLLANESFRIYMELNKEIIQMLSTRSKAFRRKESGE
jgi:TRAP-type uncharacterized transport system substrate-binding protein